MKDKVRQVNAWAKIHETVGRKPESATHDWQVLLKKYSKKMMKSRKTSISGVSSGPVLKAEKFSNNKNL